MAWSSAIFPIGNLYQTLREALGKIFRNEDFASLYPERGQPSLVTCVGEFSNRFDEL
jgi:hypothetical protein